MPEVHNLAVAVARRRRQLGLTLDEVQAAGGPSDVTTGKIEKGHIPEPSARTLRRLDAALRWVDGSAARTLTGGAPERLEDIPPRTSGAGGVDAGTDSVTLPLTAVNDLAALAKNYERLAATLDDDPRAGELRTLNGRLDVLVDRIMRAWLTTQVESLTTGPEPLHGHPMIEMLLGDYLDRSAAPPTADDADDLHYLRWLTGRAGDLDARSEQRFVARWRSRRENDT